MWENTNQKNLKRGHFSCSEKSKKIVFIGGDSMIKKIDGDLLTKSINHKLLVKVRPFITAKTIDMYDHLKPTWH